MQEVAFARMEVVMVLLLSHWCIPLYKCAWVFSSGVVSALENFQRRTPAAGFVAANASGEHHYSLFQVAWPRSACRSCVGLGSAWLLYAFSWFRRLYSSAGLVEPAPCFPFSFSPFFPGPARDRARAGGSR